LDCDDCTFTKEQIKQWNKAACYDMAANSQTKLEYEAILSNKNPNRMDKNSVEYVHPLMYFSTNIPLMSQAFIHELWPTKTIISIIHIK
jgi:hypothetical protein